MNRLRILRKNRRLTIKEVAYTVGITEQALSYYEREERDPKRETWIKLADYYDVPVSYLMGLPDGLVQHINKTQSMTFEELHEAIIQWAENRNMISPKNTSRQYMKVSEELGEIAEGINKNNREQVEDSLGDILVTLIILAQDLNFDLLDCLNSAYNVIKDRKGKTINGVFVKESDLHE